MRVVRPVVRRADELLAERGQEPLPAGVTARKLRQTFASLLFVRREDPPTVMAQLDMGTGSAPVPNAPRFEPFTARFARCR